METKKNNIERTMITWHSGWEGELLRRKNFLNIFAFFSSGNVMMMMVANRSHKNIPTPATFLAPETFYPNFIRRPNILNWGPSFQTERDVAVSKSSGVVEKRYSLKTGHLKYLAVRTFSGAVFHITSRVIFYFLPRVMNTLDVIYRWNV